MIILNVCERQATALVKGRVTTDSVGLPVEVNLSPEYDGLAVWVCFRAGETAADVALIEGTEVKVPSQCLQVAGEALQVGVWAGDGDGNVRIPTVWASAGTIKQGTERSGIDPSTPEPDWAAQVQQAAANAVATANSVRADADAGAFDGEDGYSPTATVEQLADGATITITDKDGTTTATVHDGTNGRDGRDGTDGADGYSPTATVTQTASGATISITDKSGTTTASVSNGTDGTDGADGVDGFSPTVDVQPITGGHEVTITDADGAHSFDVMDGDPPAPGSITDEMLAPDGIKPQVAQLWGNQLTGTMSGTIDTTADAYAAPPMALSVEGASTQSGTPTPDAPVPILSVDALTVILSGWNLFDLSKVNTNVHTVTGTTIKAGGSTAFQDFYSGASMTSTKTYTAAEVAKMLYLPAGTYTLKVASASNAIECYYVDPNTRRTGRELVWNVTQKTFTIDRGGYIVLTVRNAGSTVTDLQINAGSTALLYTPFTVGITTVPDLLPEGTDLRSLPDGTKDELHLSYLRPSTRAGWAWYSREVVTRVGEEQNLNQLNWVRNSSNGIFYVESTIYVPDYMRTVNTPSLATFAQYTGTVTGTFQQSAKGDNTYGLLTTGYAQRGIYVKATAYADVASFIAALAGQSLNYALATPVTTQLDPIELPELPAPTCTVWCDGGNTQPSFVMQYVQDTNIVVQQLTAETAIAYASIAAVDGPTATASHAIGTYLTMDGTLYKVTRAIAVGETIAAGTNVTATTVMAELIARTA